MVRNTVRSEGILVGIQYETLVSTLNCKVLPSFCFRFLISTLLCIIWICLWVFRIFNHSWNNHLNTQVLVVVGFVSSKRLITSPTIRTKHFATSFQMHILDMGFHILNPFVFPSAELACVFLPLLAKLLMILKGLEAWKHVLAAHISAGELLS